MSSFTEIHSLMLRCFFQTLTTDSSRVYLVNWFHLGRVSADGGQGQQSTALPPSYARQLTLERWVRAKQKPLAGQSANQL